MNNDFKQEYIQELKGLINNTSSKNYERDLIAKLIDYCLDDGAITEEEYKTIKKTIKLTNKKQLATKEMLFDSLADSLTEKIGLAYGLTVIDEPNKQLIFLYDEKKKAIELNLNGKEIHSFSKNDFVLYALKTLFDNLEKAY